MPKKGHTEEDIIAALKQHESGDKAADICRKLGISQATFYLWKKQYRHSARNAALIQLIRNPVSQLAVTVVKAPTGRVPAVVQR